MTRRIERGSIMLVVLLGLAILGLIGFIVYGNIRPNTSLQKTENAAPAGKNYQTPTLSPETQEDGTQPEISPTGDSDIEKLDAEFEAIDTSLFSETELSNTSLGL